MSKSKKSESQSHAAPATPKPGTLAQQAQHWHQLISQSEQDIAPIYWKLGAVIEEIRQEGQLNWKELLKHCDALNLRRSRVTRALRIKKRYAKPEALDGLKLYESLGHNKRTSQPAVHQDVGAPLTTPEYQAALRFERSFQTRERAVEVLRMVLAGEKPVDGKSDEGGTDDGEPNGGKPNNGKPAGGEPVLVAAPVVPEPAAKPQNGRLNGKARHALQVVGSSSSNGHVAG
jgi:hypothetical protein